MAIERPVYLNLLALKFPLPAMVSFLHRVSGALLFLFIPLALVVLQRAFTSEQGFLSVKSAAATFGAKVALSVLLWACWHHFLAGLRHLALDLGLGLERKVARRLSGLVLAASLGAAGYIAGAWIW